MGKIEGLKKELFADIEHKFKDKNFSYKESDRLQVCVHRVLDGYVSYISISETEELANELGSTKMFEVEQEYLSEFGQLTEKATVNPIDKLRLLLFYYFE